jgi:hypothetical protein
MEEVTQQINSDSVPTAAVFLTAMSLLLEGIRSTAQWTAKIKLLDSRWRLLSYGTANIALLSFFAFLSPIITFAIGQVRSYMGGNGILWVGSGQAKPIADFAMLTVVPLGIAQFVMQLCAAPYIYRELGINAVPSQFRQGNPCLRAATAPVLLAILIFLMTYLSLTPAFNLIREPFEFNPTHRCNGNWQEAGLNQLKTHCEVLDFTNPPGAFERNANGQITTARYNCLQQMKHSGGNTFALVKRDAQADNQCVVMKCPSAGRYELTPVAEVTVEETDPLVPVDTLPVEVWSESCMGYSPHKRVGVQLMEWNWKDVGEECANHLGPAGVDYVHVSPPAEHVVGNRAYTKYQPTSFKLDSRSGSTEDFRQMVRKCRDHNVAIMVDFIVNHLSSSFPTPETSDEIPYVVNDGNLKQCGRNINCTGWNGTRYGSRAYDCSDYLNPSADECKIPPTTFHHTVGNDKQPSCVADVSGGAMLFNPFTGMDQCDPGFGVDLNTEYDVAVRNIEGYLLSLQDAGVTMLRVDAAQLVNINSLAFILEPFPWEFLTSEVLGWSKEAAAMFDFPFRFRVSTIYDWSWGPTMSKPMPSEKGQVGYLYTSDEKTFLPLKAPTLFYALPTYRPLGPYNKTVMTAGWSNPTVPQSEDVLVYVDNHDGMTFPMNYHLGSVYLQATLYMLFHPWGTSTQVMSSFHYPFSQNFTGPTVAVPPLKDLSSKEKEESRTNYMINLTRKVDKVRCRVHPTTPLSNDTRDWALGKCMDSDEYGCDWICQHRWPGVAALSRARHYVPKTVTVDESQIWYARDGLSFAFSVGEVTWVFMQAFSSEEVDLKSLSLSAMLPRGSYCNIAMLNQTYVSSLANWTGSDGQQACGRDYRIEVDASGNVVSGVAPKGHLGGMVVIHKKFMLDAIMQ